MQLAKQLSTVIVSAALASPMTAQGKPIELSVGIAGVSLNRTGGENVFRVSVTQPTLAVGFYVSNSAAIEPTLQASIIATDDASLTELNVGVGFPIYFGSQAGHAGLFFRPVGNIRILSADAFGGSGSASQLSFGFGLGSKSQISDRTSLRFEGVFGYALENDDFFDAIGLGAILGVSVLLR